MVLGNALSDFGIISAIFGFLQVLDSDGMGFIHGAACLDPTTCPGHVRDMSETCPAGAACLDPDLYAATIKCVDGLILLASCISPHLGQSRPHLD